MGMKAFETENHVSIYRMFTMKNILLKISSLAIASYFKVVLYHMYFTYHYIVMYSYNLFYFPTSTVWQ